MQRTREQLSATIDAHVQKMREGHAWTTFPTPGAAIQMCVYEIDELDLEAARKLEEKDPNPWVISHPHDLSNAALLRAILERTIFVDPEFNPRDPTQKHCILEVNWASMVGPFEPVYDKRRVGIADPLNDLRLIGPAGPVFDQGPHLKFQRDEVVDPVQKLRGFLGYETWFMERGLAPLVFMAIHYLSAVGFVKLK